MTRRERIRELHDVLGMSFTLIGRDMGATRQNAHALYHYRQNNPPAKRGPKKKHENNAALCNWRSKTDKELRALNRKQERLLIKWADDPTHVRINQVYRENIRLRNEFMKWRRKCR